MLVVPALSPLCTLPFFTVAPPVSVPSPDSPPRAEVGGLEALARPSLELDWIVLDWIGEVDGSPA